MPQGKLELTITLPEGVEGSLAMVAAKNPQAFVLKLPGTLSRFQHDQLRARWNELYRGTCLEGVPVIILDDFLQSVQIVDQAPPQPKIEFATPEDAVAYARDMLLCGTAYLQNGKRIDPRTVTVGPVEWSLMTQAECDAAKTSEPSSEPIGIVDYLGLFSRAGYPTISSPLEGSEKEPYIGLDGGVK